MYYRISTKPGNPFEWEPEMEFIAPGVAGSFAGDSLTYCNPMRLSDEPGRTYLFHRGNNGNPNYLVSDDDGRTWRYGGKLFDGLARLQPVCEIREQRPRYDLVRCHRRPPAQI